MKTHSTYMPNVMRNLALKIRQTNHISTLIALMVMFSFFGVSAQNNATDVDNQTTVDYDQCSGTATVRFPVRENYSICGQANQLRWIQVYAVRPGQPNTDILKCIITKLGVTSTGCDASTSTFNILGCRDYYVCRPNTNNSFVVENGVGDERFVKLTIVDLEPEFFGSPIKFYFAGVYDLECCEGTNSPFPVNAFTFEFTKSWSGGNAASITTPSISSVGSAECFTANVNWANPGAPNNCSGANYTFEVWRSPQGQNAFGKVGEMQLTPFHDTNNGTFLTPGASYDYKLRARWTTTNGRVDYGEFSALSTVLIPEPNGMISGTVKSLGGVPIGGVTVSATIQTFDNTPFCTSVPLTMPANTTTNGSGNFSFPNIFYGHSSDGPTTYLIQGMLNSDVITSEVVTLDDNMPTATANLIDQTAYSASGKVLFPSTGNCGLENTVVSAKGLSPTNVGMIHPDTTGSDGLFNLTLPGPDTYRFYSTYYTGNETVKDSVTVAIVNQTTTNITINYSKTKMLTGFVGGDCQAIFGPASVKAYTNAGCLIASTTSNGSGIYQMTLPATAMQVKVENYFPNMGPLNGMGPYNQTQTITLKSDTSLNFIFRTPIEMEVLGFPAQICSDITYPILEQFKPYPVVYKVMESTGCPIDTGYVIVIDEVGGVDGTPTLRDTIPVSNGMAFDTIIPGLPNIFADYSKPIEFQAFAGPDLMTALAATPLNLRAIVTGSAPRGQQFTTVSPQIPRLIIRDPPGDKSYSFIEQGKKFSTSSKMYSQDSEGGNIWVKAKAGVEIELISFEAGVEIGAKFSGEAVHANSEEILYEFATTDEYSTSDDPNVKGKEGDVYVGAAMNLSYANSDIISLDLAACEIKKRVELVISPETFETEFVYAESDIINVIIPSLQAIVDDPMQTAADRHRAAEGIKIWNQIIAMNEELKEEAFNGTTTLNQSFGGTAGALRKTFTETTTKTRTIEWKQLIEEQIALEAGFSLAGSGVSAGFEINLKQEFGGSTTNAVTTTTTTGFQFDDDDPNDLYTIDWAIDPVFGTPVFRPAQNAGNTSCPWELGAKRDKAFFSVPVKVKTAGTGVNSINFTFQLGNQSQTGEVRDYGLQLVSNPNGAEVNVLGATGQYWDFPNLSPGVSQDYTVIISRNPANENFHFEGLQFRFYPTCDPGNADDPIKESVYQSISAFFQSPCSDIAMSTPTVANGFLINGSSNNMLNIGIAGYDYNSMINSVEMEYSPAGANTWNASNIVLAKSGLVNNNPPMTLKMWQTTGIPDGDYDIRLKLICPSGGNTSATYSERVTGVIDRSAPVVFGLPEPIDDDYAMGDEISVTFDEVIDCSNTTVSLVMQPGNVSLASTFACMGNKLVVTPGMDLSTMLRKSFEITVTGLEDSHGNVMEAFTWGFSVGEVDSDNDGSLDNTEVCLGSALDFDGVNDYLQIPHQSNLNVVDADGFTIEGWVYSTTNGNRTIIGKNLDYIVELTAGSNTVGLFLSGEWKYSSGSIPLNEWSHIAISYDGVTKIASFFIDGSLSGQQQFVLSNFANSDLSPLVIGYQAATGQYVNPFKGRLDDLTLWDRPLSQTEIKATMAARLTGSESNLIAYYDFNDAPFCVDNTGTTNLIDAANTNNASLINFALTGCSSNFGSERSLDSDLDGIPDACDVLEACFGMPGSADSDGDGFLECADLCPGSADVSLHFDGADDQIVVPHHPSQNVVDGDFTFSAWINRVEGTNQTIFSKGPGGGGTDYIFQIYSDKIGLYLGDGLNSIWYFSSVTIPTNAWSHVAVSYNSITDSLSFFLNGSLFNRVLDSLGTHINGNTDPLYIGRQGHICNCNFFEGRMDDVTIWNRSLSSFELKATMAAPLTGSEQGLVAYYDFNEAPACNSANTAIPVLDKGPNTQNGALTNFNFSSCVSNWVEGRNLDSDNDNIGDACDVLSLCPPNFANANSLTGTQNLTQVFATNGLLQSQQVILSPAQVIYNSLTATELLQGFEVQSGAQLQILLDGCNQ